MLSRNELASKVLPVIKTKNMSENDYDDDQCCGRKSNIIKKALLKNNNIELYLPTNKFAAPKEIISTFAQENKKKLSETEIIEEKSMVLKPKQIIIPKKNFEFQESQSKDYLEKKAKFKEVHEKLEKFHKEIPKPREGRPNFNLKALKEKVRQITKSVKLNLKDNVDIAKKYRLHAISSKKDSKEVEEYLRLEKNMENIYLQKVILDVEYDNVVNEGKKVKIIAKVNKKKRIKDDGKDILLAGLIDEKLNNILKELTPKKRKKKKTVSPKTKCYGTNSVLITELNKRNKEIRFDQQDFLDKYERSLMLVKSEEKDHKEKRVFTTDEINKIMKSKKDIVIDGLKNEYIHKYNEEMDLKTKIDQRGSETYKEVQLRNKELQHKKIGKKVCQAFSFEEDGILGNVKYPIKDYFQDLDFHF